MDIRPDDCDVYKNIIGSVTLALPGPSSDAARDLAKSMVKAVAEAAAAHLDANVDVLCPPAGDPNCTEARKMAGSGTVREDWTTRVVDGLFLSQASCTYELAFGCFRPPPPGGPAFAKGGQGKPPPDGEPA